MPSQQIKNNVEFLFVSICIKYHKLDDVIRNHRIAEDYMVLGLMGVKADMKNTDCNTPVSVTWIELFIHWG